MTVPGRLLGRDQKSEMGRGVASVDHQLVVEQSAKWSHFCHPYSKKIVEGIYNAFK